MDLQTLRNQVRDLVSETAANLPDSTLNDMIGRATQRCETDFTDDYGTTPRQMIARDSGTVLSTGYPLPSDWLRARSVRIGSGILRYTPPDLMPTDSAGEDSTVDLVYYQKIPELVNDTDTNWLLDTASRVYLYATAIEYAIWGKEDQSSYMAEYTNAREKTERANSPRGSGGFGRAKGVQNGQYSIVGENMIFGYT